nr:putative NRPS/PKS hybrid synthase module B6C [uncultured bacterium]
MFGYPTIAELAPIVETLNAGIGKDTCTDISLVSREIDLPLSFAQERLWFLEKLLPGNPAYLVSMALRLKGELHIDALLASLDAILQRHEALRTRFVSRQNVPVQIIDNEVRFDLAREDISTLPETGKEREIEASLEQEKKVPFDLSEDIPIRGKLLRLDKSDHALIITMHHIVSDGWSMGVFFRELGDCYAAFSRHQQPALASLPIQYADFAAWQREWLSGEELDRQLGYWRDRLEDLQVLDLPTDRARPAKQTFEGALEFLTLDQELGDRLEQFSKDAGVTLFMTMLAGYMLLLQRYSGQDDIVIGTPIANRNRAELEGLIAVFVNMLVMRVDCSGNPDFNSLLKRVTEVALGAFEHQDLPFEKLVDELQVERDPSRNPLFQVHFGMQNAPLEALELQGLTLEQIGLENRTTRFDLECHVSSRDGRLHVGFIYNTNLFDPATIKQMQRHYANLLSAAVAAPGQPVGLLPMLDQDERRSLLERWNQDEVDYSSSATLAELFAARVSRNPDAVAVECNGASLSYAALDERSNRLARYLQAHGVGAEVRVGLCLERSVDLPVAILGILKAGGCYVPMDPEYPVERLEYILEDCAAPILLTQSGLQAGLPHFTGQTVCLDADWPAIRQQDESAVKAASGADNCAYVIYTSGSTGQPKGVEITHRNVTRLFGATEHWYGFNENDVWTLFHSSAFDFSVWEIWGALLHGGRLVVVPFVVSRSPESFYDLLADAGVTVLNQTPSAFKQLVGVDRTRDPELLAALRLVIFGGEALNPRSLEPWFENHGDRQPQLVNMYGITETTVHVSYRSLDLSVLDSGASVIGRPIPDLQIYILDRYLQPVPAGVTGEMYIGGAGLARGYLNREELTRERFIAHPFTDRQGDRLYKTGDLARYLPDGDIEYLGRNDSQVKLRGFRIELGEIESVLCQHEQVREAVVLCRDDEAQGKRLVAYVVSGSDDESLAVELKNHAREKLPEYMLPAAVMVLDSFPLTPNGKLDQRALPEPVGDRQSAEALVEPSSELERQLVDIWRQLLGVEEVGVHDNFFDLGGHSLLATQIVSRLREQMNIELPLADVFSYPTPAELAPIIEAMLPEAGTVEAGAIRPIDRDGDIPLSFAQKRLWFLDRLQPGNPAYIIPLPLRLKGELRVDALKASLNAILRRHEVLRTRIVNTASGPIQIIDHEVDFELTQVDLSALAAEDLDEEILARIEIEKVRPFDLATEVLIRGTLFHVSDVEHVLLLTMHHIISDAWSLGVLNRELGEFYRAFTAGREPAVAELPIQYADFAAWQRQWLSGAQLDKQLDYWNGQLKGLAALDLPTDRPRPPMQTYNGAIESLTLNKQLSERLERLSKNSGVTLFTTLLAVYILMLRRYSDQEDIAVGTPMANRNRSELENLVGFFINMIIFRSNCTGNPGFGEFLQQVSKMVMGALEHQDIPFEKLLESLQVERDPSRNPLFQVTFVLQNAPMQPLQLEGVSLEPIADANRTIRFDLECNVWNGPQGLQIRFDYNTDLFDAESIRRMLIHYGNLLDSVTRDPMQSIDLLPMLSAADEQLLLKDWNATGQDFPPTNSLQQMFEAQVERSPSAIAVECEGVALSYAELNARSNQMARNLQARGVGPEVLVGLYLERSIELVVGMLGILKAGGAYVPLDPDYPQQRLAFMLEDSRIPMLLTQERLRDTLPYSTAVDVICLDSGWQEIAGQSEENPGVEVDAENLAYVLYTSGSTGKPKGVAVPHRAVCNHMLWMQDVYPLSEADKVLQKTPFSFDASVWEFFAPLIAGARLVLAQPDAHKNPLYLAQLIEAQQITRIQVVPTLLKMLLDDGLIEECRSLRHVFCGGEALLPELQQRFFACHPAELVNLYGPTEVTIDSITWNCDRDGQHRSVPIGRPIANDEVYILDRHRQPVPIGVRGELYIGGAGLARGYLNRPELTAERFIAHPFSDRTAARLYQTGDLARYLPDGNIEYLGRTDQQVKLRGFRIELGEVQTELRAHELVQDAVASVYRDETGAERLVAYLVTGDGNEEVIGIVREHLKTRLTEYMMPSVFMLIDEIALTPSGKVDYKRLPVPEMARHVLTPMVVPSGQLEKDIAEVWKQVLKLEEIGVEDNFFDLGGDSYLMIQLHTLLEERLAREIPITDLFRFSTVRSFAQQCSDSQASTREKQARLKTKVSKQRAALRKKRKSRT